MSKKKVMLVGLTIAALALVTTVYARPSILGGLADSIGNWHEYWQILYTDQWAMFTTSLISTDSSTYIDMDQTSIEITLYAPCDLVISFSAECRALPPTSSSQETLLDEGVRVSSPGLVYVRCLVGGINAQGPEYLTSDTDTEWETRTVTFIANNVPKGTYTVKIQWKTGAELGYVYWRSLSIIANGAGHLG